MKTRSRITGLVLALISASPLVLLSSASTVVVVAAAGA